MPGKESIPQKNLYHLSPKASLLEQAQEENRGEIKPRRNKLPVIQAHVKNGH